MLVTMKPTRGTEFGRAPFDPRFRGGKLPLSRGQALGDDPTRLVQLPAWREELA